jgi:predicted permease
MTTTRRFFLRLLSFFRTGAAEAELSREIRAHLQLLEDEHVAKGMSRDDARLAARRAFGGVEQAKDHQRDARGFRWLEDSRIDLKLGVRMLVKYPGLSIVGGAGLAVGIAIGAAFFALTYSQMYATLPVEGGERIVALEIRDVELNNEVRQAMHDFNVWRRELTTFEEIGAFRTIGRNLIIPGGSVEPVQVAQVTAAGFNITRVAPAIGRPLVEADESITAPPVVVIGYDVWQSRFRGDASVLGRELRLGNVVHTIVGVMPEGFAFPVNHHYWTPLNTDTSAYGRREGPGIYIFGRLRDGVTLEQAQAELSALGARAAAAFPDTHARLQPQVMRYAHSILDIHSSTIFEIAMIQSIMSLLAVIVAVNVAVLVYARTATRQREIAVRTAIGASRKRIVGQLFIEALVLSGVASFAGIALARFGIAQGITIFEAEGSGATPYFVELGMPAAAYAYVAVLTFFAATVSGVLPALHATGQRAQDTLKQTSGTDGLRLGRTWTALIVAQVAIAVAGLPAIVNIGSSAVKNGMTHANYREDAFLAAIISTDPDAPPGMMADVYARESALRFGKLKTDLLASLEGEAVVEDVTLASAIPGDEPRARIAIDGAAIPQSGAPIVRYNHIAADFFDAFGARIINGRMLRDSDGTGSAQAIVVNNAFVMQLLGGANAVGRRVRYMPPRGGAPAVRDTTAEYEIVGVVSDLSTNSMEPELVQPVVFHPPDSATRTTALIRMRGQDPARFASRLRDLTSALDPTVRLQVMPFSELKQQASIAFRLMLLAIGLVVVTVLLLSAAGIYAMMSFTVSQRRKEIGIRAAMGADAGQLLRSIFTKAALQLAAGVAVGLVMALVIDRASDGELLGSSGRTLVPVTAVLMTIVGLFATVGPARRGLRIQPTEALRAE